MGNYTDGATKQFRTLSDVISSENYPAGGWANQASDNLHQRCLSGSIFSKQQGHFFCLQAQFNFLQNIVIAERFGNSINLQNFERCDRQEIFIHSTLFGSWVLFVRIKLGLVHNVRKLVMQSMESTEDRISFIRCNLFDKTNQSQT